MKSTLKTWTGLGLATALAGAGLAGCAGEGGESGQGSSESASDSAIAGEGGEGGEGGEAGEGGASTGALPIEQRLAFMAGHVEAGLALYRAGDGKAAAPHLLHPISETHASEREGLAALGFDPAPFKAVSKAIEAGKPASQITSQLASAEANLDAMRSKAGGDPAALISYLMDITRAEYAIAVKDGAVTDPGEYQDAWGFARVAREIADELKGDNAADVRGQLDTLIALWPANAPIPPADPAPAGQVSAQASKVALALGRKRT